MGICCDAVKFWVFWTLQAVWVWVTLLPVMILNGSANNPSKFPKASPALQATSTHFSYPSFCMASACLSDASSVLYLPVPVVGV